VVSHPHLVSLHQDVILECIDHADISIRMRALDLAVGMVNSENLKAIIERLLRQLLNAPIATHADDITNDRGMHSGVEPLAESDDDEAEEAMRQREIRSKQPAPLPEDYRFNAIKSILTICSRDTYANVSDFEWYIDILVKLVKACPSTKSSTSDESDVDDSLSKNDISYEIGYELQNVAVRVKSMRPEATSAAQSLLMIDSRDHFFPAFGNGGQGVLESCAWIVGEYVDMVTNPDGVLNSLLHASSSQLPARMLAIYIHAALKTFAMISGSHERSWTPERRTTLSLLMARIIYFLEPLASHPDLDVQERAVEYLELMKLASEAASGHAVSHDSDFAEPPLLLTQAVPALFTGTELNPVSAAALYKVPPPEDIDLSMPINDSLQSILKQAEVDDMAENLNDEFQIFYLQRMVHAAVPESISASERLDLAAKEESSSYQSYQSNVEAEPLNDHELERKRAERRERYKDDPFYIASDDESRMHNIIRNTNGDDLDIDSIPIMDLELEARSGSRTPIDLEYQARQKRAARRKHVEITGDENIDGEDPISRNGSRLDLARALPSRGKKSLLEVDSSGLGLLTLEGRSGNGQLDIEQREAEEKALREVERLRLEMQRASERIHAKEESVVVKKKKKKVKPVENVEVAVEQKGGEGVVKKKKKKKKVVDGEEVGSAKVEDDVVAKSKKKKKRRQPVEINEPSGS
jgi:AP-3 complex subunit delta-1